MSFLVGIVVLAVVTALACALPGVWVVLRGRAMLVDAIGHAVLPGIVVGYLLTSDIGSPWLVVGAAVAGLLVVLGSQWLGRTGLITGDAPQGLVFPALFSIGVILVSQNFAGIHFDTHSVLVGDLNLVAFEHLHVAGVSIGPPFLYVMLAVLLVNTLVLRLLHDRLSAATLDEQFAASLGMRTGWLDTCFMLVVAITVTAAFNAAGAVLVVALVVVPAATARVLTHRLRPMFWITVVVAVAGAVGGFVGAYFLEVPTSAGIAAFYGVLFGAALVRAVATRRPRARLPRSRRDEPLLT